MIIPPFRYLGRYKKLTIISCFPPLLSSAAIMTWGTGTNLNRLWIEMALANLGGGIMSTSSIVLLLTGISRILAEGGTNADFSCSPCSAVTTLLSSSSDLSMPVTCFANSFSPSLLLELTAGLIASVSHECVLFPLPQLSSSSLASDLLIFLSRRDMAMAIAASFLFRAIGQVLGVSLAFAAQQWVLERSLVERLGESSGEVSSFVSLLLRFQSATDDIPFLRSQLIRRIIHTPSTTIPQLLPAIKEQAVLAYLISIQVSRVVSFVSSFFLPSPSDSSSLPPHSFSLYSFSWLSVGS